MVNRIVVNVIDVSVHIFLVSDNMVPESVLPQASGVPTRCFPVSTGKDHLQPMNYARKIGSSRVNNEMTMVGQNYPRAHVEIEDTLAFAE